MQKRTTGVLAIVLERAVAEVRVKKTTEVMTMRVTVVSAGANLVRRVSCIFSYSSTELHFSVL